MVLKAWQNWPTTLLAESVSNQVLIFSIAANDSETNNGVCQAMLASFAKA